MNDDEALLHEEIRRALFPFAFSQLALYAKDQLPPKPIRFAYYTSADTAFKIIQNSELWLRDSRCMNDFREVWHGIEQTRAYLADLNTGLAFIKAVDACHANISPGLITKFNSYAPAMWTSTNLMCLSHNEEIEDQFGRLSMWRAYGRERAGVAIIFKRPAEHISDHLNVFMNPAIYSDDVAPALNQVVQNIVQQRALFAALPRQIFENWLFSMLVTYAVTLKHPGFYEEKEWRLIYMPGLWPSSYLRPSPETVAGIPQTVYKLDLVNATKLGVSGLTHLDLIDKIIVGPTQFPAPIIDQFHILLRNAGFPDWAQRVQASGIPIRT